MGYQFSEICHSPFVISYFAKFVFLESVEFFDQVIVYEDSEVIE